jgi:hypothetical protein
VVRNSPPFPFSNPPLLLSMMHSCLSTWHDPHMMSKTKQWDKRGKLGGESMVLYSGIFRSDAECYRYSSCSSATPPNVARMHSLHVLVVTVKHPRCPNPVIRSFTSDVLLVHKYLQMQLKGCTSTSTCMFPANFPASQTITHYLQLHTYIQ